MSQRRLPAEIYWRRRLLLLAVVIAVVWGVLQLTSGGVDEVEKPAAAPTTTAPATTAPPAPAVKVNGIVDVALETGTAACDPQLVRITPTVRPGQLTRGPVDIGLVVSTTATEPCTLTPDDADALAVISANGTAIWDSTVCETALLTDPVTLSPQWATLVSVAWSGRGSGSQCNAKEGWATPGKYAVQIGTLGGEPGKATFSLDARPAPAKTTKPSATPTTPTPADED